MSTINDPQPESPAPNSAPEELVAYLDGELSPDECRQVEERLATDADYRQQLRELDQAWEALDSLPATSPGDDFARTTIEMVTLAAQQEQKERTVQAVATNRRRRRLWAIIGGTAVLASFVAARLLMPDANARLLNDLPVITQMDLLDQIQDVNILDFLRKLSKEVPIDKLATDESAVEREVARFAAASNPSPDARRQWIESLLPDQKADLAAQANQFNGLQKEERDRLKGLAQQIAAASDAAKLQKTLAAYGQWLARRTSGEQSRLRSLATDDRIDRIRDTVRREERQPAWRLSEADAVELRKVISNIHDERKEQFMKAMRRRDRDDRFRRGDIPPEAMALMVAHWTLRNDDIDDRTQDRIVDNLSPEAQQHLTTLERRGGEDRKKQQLWHWMHDVMLPKREAGDLEKFFAEKLGPNQRERLLSLPKEKMEAELEQMYLGSRFLGGVEWLGGPGPGAGGPPGPPPRDDFDGQRRFNRPPGDEGSDGRRRRGPPPEGTPPSGPNAPPSPSPGQK